MHFETTKETETMKKSVTMFVMVFIAIGMYISGAISGTIVESRWHFFKPVEVNGLPKGSIPEVGAAMHIEAAFPDRTFVAVYAGERAYYKPVDKNQHLEPGRTYEVEIIRIQNGGHQKALTLIKDGTSVVPARIVSSLAKSK